MPTNDLPLEVDQDVVIYGQGAAAYYEEVMGRQPELGFAHLPGGDTAIVLEGWLWVFYSGQGVSWTARLVIPPSDPFLSRTPEFSRMHMAESREPSFDEAVLWALSWETRRLFRIAQEEFPRRKW